MLGKDLERIRRFYRSEGYYDAAIRAARIVRLATHEVRVEIEVTPGAPVVITERALIGLDQVPRELARDVEKALRLRVGKRLVEKSLHDDAKDIEQSLADEGHAYVKVESSARRCPSRNGALASSIE